jgi:hypothetical protein
MPEVAALHLVTPSRISGLVSRKNCLHTLAPFLHMLMVKKAQKTSRTSTHMMLDTCVQYPLEFYPLAQLTKDRVIYLKGQNDFIEEK